MNTMMKILVVAVFLTFFAFCSGQDSTCVTYPPRQKPIDGQSDIQPRDVQSQIDDALKTDDEVRISVDNIAAERALVYQEDKLVGFYQDTCPRYLKYITSLYMSNGAGKIEKCFVVNPQLQRVTYVASCGSTNCYGSIFYKSQCVRTGWTRLQFWVWCPTCGFKLIARWYPQCCSCYRWTPCLVKA